MQSETVASLDSHFYFDFRWITNNTIIEYETSIMTKLRYPQRKMRHSCMTAEQKSNTLNPLRREPGEWVVGVGMVGSFSEITQCTTGHSLI